LVVVTPRHQRRIHLDPIGRNGKTRDHAERARATSSTRHAAVRITRFGALAI
jgi:hypothetical protein